MSSSEIQVEIRELKDLFLRRLLEDKAKAKVIDGLLDSLKRRDEIDRFKVFSDLFQESLVALDRLVAEEPSKELVASVKEELLEVFRRRGLTKVPTDGLFDPSIHEIVSTVAAGNSFNQNEIVDVQRDGFFLGDNLLRPARVIVAMDR